MRFVRVPRLPRWPLWAVALTAAWLGLVGLASLLAPGAVVCSFRRLTGIPCPGCGLTRGVTAIANGDIARGLAYNPLLLAAILLLLALAALRLALGRAPRLRPTRAWLLPALLLLAANWAYVIRTDRQQQAREEGQSRGVAGSSGTEEGGVRGQPLRAPPRAPPR